VVRPEPFDSRAEASAWPAALRDDRKAALAERDAAVRVLNLALRAQRAARADPYIAADQEGLRQAVEAMEAVLRRHRLRG
jgi:hypothetical protein